MLNNSMVEEIFSWRKKYCENRGHIEKAEIAAAKEICHWWIADSEK